MSAHRHRRRVAFAAALTGCVALVPVALASPLAAAAWERPATFAAMPDVGAPKDALSRASPVLGSATARLMQATAPDGRRAPVGLPSFNQVDPATRTVYVSSDSEDITVIDGRRCHARRATGCQDAVVATIPGGGAGMMVIDQATRTMYVSSPATGRIMVVDAAACHAGDTSGCAQAPARVEIGSVPVGLALDAASHTLYVGDDEHGLSVVDVTACHAGDTSGCAHTPAKLLLGPGAVFPTVDPTTRTLYVPLAHTEPPGPVLVLDAARCNASTTAGCDPVGEASAGVSPLIAHVDQTTRTVFVANAGELGLSVFDADACNAQDASGCGAPVAAVPVGPQPNANLVVDEATRTLYVVNGGSDTLSAIDLRRCSARRPAGCARRWPTIATGDLPFWVAVDQTTGTLYVTERIPEDLAALDARSCNANRTTGCRREAPTAAIPNGTLAVAADAAHHTLLVGSGGSLGVIDTRACRAGRLTGCRAGTQMTGFEGAAVDIAVDRATHTAYVADPENGRIAVLDTNACRGGRVAGCVPVASARVDGDPSALAVDARTHAVVSANFGAGTMSVLDGRRCSAVDRSGCDAARTVPAGIHPFGVAIEQATGTVYVSDFGEFDGDLGPRTVTVFDEPACLAGGPCEPLAEITVGATPIGLAIDRSTRTLYVANFAFFELPGTLSVVDLRHCRVGDLSGCAGPWPTTRTGRGPRILEVDAATHTVFVADYGDASVSVVQGATCNATSQTGCGRMPPRVPVGDIPIDLSIDPSTHTVYTSDAPELRTSIIDARRPCRAPVHCLR